MVKRLKQGCFLIVALILGVAIGFTGPPSQPDSERDSSNSHSTQTSETTRDASSSKLSAVTVPPSFEIPGQSQPVRLPAPSFPVGTIQRVAWQQPIPSSSAASFRVDSISQEWFEKTVVALPLTRFEVVPVRSGKDLIVRVQFSAGGVDPSLKRFTISREGIAPIDGNVKALGDELYDITFPAFVFDQKQRVRFTAFGINDVVKLETSHVLQAIRDDALTPRIGGSTHSQFRRPDTVSQTQNVYLNVDHAFLRFAGTTPLGASGLKAYVLTMADNASESAWSVSDTAKVEVDQQPDRTGTFFARVLIPSSGLRHNEVFKVLLLSDYQSSIRAGTRLIECQALQIDNRFALSISDVNKSKIEADSALTVQELSRITVKRTGGTDSADVDLVVRDLDSPQMTQTLGIRTGGVEQTNSIEFSPPLVGGDSLQAVRLDVTAYLGDAMLNAKSDPVVVQLLQRPLKVVDFREGQIGVVAGANQIKVTFPNDQPLTFAKPLENGNVATADIGGFGGQLSLAAPHTTQILTPQSIAFDSARNQLIYSYDKSATLIGDYLFTFQPGNLTDVFGNQLVAFEKRFGGGTPGYAENALPGRVMPGIHGATGEYVAFQEFAPPREVPNGFNPNDKVETRVARLYFYRDAHRVAQIINRKVESHNRHGVAVSRQLAEKARTTADQLTQARQQAEREAIRRAQETREIENKLSDARRNFERTLSTLRQDALRRDQATDETQRAQLDSMVSAQESAARTFAQQVASLESQVDASRQAEADAREQAEQKESEEQLARQEQFRREVAAAHADPDTYAEGVPDSSDPIEQTSISVIGEGLIHLRGPLKGVNQIRMMIDQIDTPVGQVRVNLHTTQINGDDADKLEVVSSQIQTYIDQARFLSVQTGEMLRKSVMIVAAQRAEEARGIYPGQSQLERDQRYLHAFFGRDFIDELRTIDSEFLHTGNKLISLHSMDVTSLSSALLLLSLANNSTRAMILQEFDRQMHQELPIAEQKYLHAGMHMDGKQCLQECDQCGNKKKFGNHLRRMWNKHHGPPPVYSLAQNAEFQSLKGFFDTSLPHDDTMTPLQREFVRLAQIFKSRLITELEYKQRVMERALIEDRLGNRQQELLDAQEKEDQAEQQLAEAERAKGDAIEKVVVELTRAQANIRQATVEAVASAKWFGTNLREFISDMRKPERRREIDEFRRSPAYSLPTTVQFYGTILDGVAFDTEKTRRGGIDEKVVLVTDDVNSQSVKDNLILALDKAIEAAETLMNFNTGASLQSVKNVHAHIKLLKDSMFIPETRIDSRLMLDYESLENFADDLVKLEEDVMQAVEVQENFSRQRIDLLRRLRDSSTDFETYFLLWNNYRSSIQRIFATHPDSVQVLDALAKVDSQFDRLLEIDVKTNFRLREANEKRRPLDHKKFLDMLIDDLEEKYIELLEGTRAHTANIDNYLKRLTTALDDDFNTQFYNPTFRSVRSASQFDDVEFGQTETTNVLANNREFAKVSPSATMEFDLPKRDILIKEGLDSAMAIYNDVGALVNDPNLMALAASQSGNSPADIGAGYGGGLGSVRSVLPGLSSDTQEGVLAQASGTRPRFESNVEALIPDPAIYKFETGTGFEIRPVIEPDGQAVVFDFNYMYTTNIREPVDADEKHLGRVKRHFVDTDVQLSNFELREVSRYVVALKAERTARGVPLLEDIPVVGALWRPLPSQEKSLQQNIIMAQATIFPTLFDLMGLRWAPAVADIDPLRLSNREFIVRGRHQFLENRVYDVSSSRVDEFLRVPEAERRADLYRSQSTIPSTHPNGYRGPGLDLKDSSLREGYQLDRAYPPSQFIPDKSNEGSIYRPGRSPETNQMPSAPYSLEPVVIEQPAGQIESDLYSAPGQWSPTMMNP